MKLTTIIVGAFPNSRTLAFDVIAFVTFDDEASHLWILKN